MNLKINQIPENWNPNDRLSFLKWMSETIQSSEYSKILD